MKLSIVNRSSGLALILGALLFIFNKVNDIIRVFFNRSIPDLIEGDDLVLVLAGQALLMIGLWGCYHLYARRSNTIGKIGLILSMGGVTLMGFGHIAFTPLVQDESLFIFVIAGVFVMLAGLTLFGAVNLHIHVLQYWQPLPLVTGLLGITAFIIITNRTNPYIFLSLRTLFGVCLVLNGFILWLDKGTLTVGGKQVGGHAG